MCGESTELQRVLKKFQFKNPNAKVGYDSTKGVATVELHEHDLLSLDTHLESHLLPLNISSIVVNYTTSDGRVHFEYLTHLAKKINASNRGKAKTNPMSITYVDDLAKDTDDWTGSNANLADDNSGSYGSYKTFTIGINDPSSTSDMIVPIESPADSLGGVGADMCGSCIRGAYDTTTQKCKPGFKACSTNRTDCCIR